MFFFYSLMFDEKTEKRSLLTVGEGGGASPFSADTSWINKSIQLSLVFQHSIAAPPGQEQVPDRESSPFVRGKRGSPLCHFRPHPCALRNRVSTWTPFRRPLFFLIEQRWRQMAAMRKSFCDLYRFGACGWCVRGRLARAPFPPLLPLDLKENGSAAS